MDARGRIYRGLTGGRRPPSGVGEEVQSLGGTRQAAQQLGVSQRTVRRWLQRDREGRPVASRNTQRLTNAARVQARRAALSPRREARMRSRGATIRARGNMGPGAIDPRYVRRNRTALLPDASPEFISDLLDAYNAGDDDRALEILNDRFGDEYGVSGWTFEDLSQLDFLTTEE